MLCQNWSSFDPNFLYFLASSKQYSILRLPSYFYYRQYAKCEQRSKTKYFLFELKSVSHSLMSSGKLKYYKSMKNCKKWGKKVWTFSGEKQWGDTIFHLNLVGEKFLEKSRKKLWFFKGFFNPQYQQNRYSWLTS